MKLLESLCGKANLSILKARNPTKKVPGLIVVACCIALLAMLVLAILGRPVADSGIHFVPNGEGVFTIGHRAHAAAADFVADGVDDHIQFQQALDALPASGGKLVVLAGTYNFGATVSRAIDNVTIQGIGQATVISRDGINPVFSAGAQSNWVFRDFKTDAGGIEVAAATNYTVQNLTIGVNYIAFKSDVAAAAWDIPAGRTATLVVAASDSSPQSKAQADFVADGVDDQVTIQAAINALPAGGGRVLLMEGTYTVSGVIRVLSGVSLEGVGWGAVYRLRDGHNAHIGMILADSNSRIANFTIDANNAMNDPAFHNSPITIVHATNVVIEGMRIIDGYTGINLMHSPDSRIVNNYISGMRGDGIGPNWSSRLIVMGNTIVNCFEGIDMSESPHSMVVGNTIEGSATLGIGIPTGADYNIVSGNIITNSAYIGIGIAGNHAIVSGNAIKASRHFGIRLIGTRSTLVKGNQIVGVAINSGISLEKAATDCVVA